MTFDRLVPPRRRVALLAALFLVVCGAGAAAGAAEGPAEPAAARILLVRHAETDAAGPDPGLSAAGRQRADRLAALLASEGIARVLATDTRRARSTAGPVAERLGLEVEIYDPRRLGDLAAALRAGGGTVLVVGHSNTTPQLVRLLGGDPGEAIGEAEYDRLYRVDPANGETAMERYPASEP